MDLLISLVIIVGIALLIIKAGDAFIGGVGAQFIRIVVGIIAFILIIEKLWPILKSGRI